MKKSTKTAELPALYALVHSGLEEVASDEITLDFGGAVKKADKSIVVFRVPEIDRSLFNLRTTEDIYLFAWGTGELSFRAADLDSIRKWTQRDVEWQKLLQIHHSMTPKPKGKPSFRLVVQMTGEHGYRRIDARKAFWQGLQQHIPTSWREADENASIEFWLTIHGDTAVAGIRLSDRTMRHRTYKFEHFAASLRPTVAAAIARLANFKPKQTIVDPFCGAGTILAESWLLIKRLAGGRLDEWTPTLLGGDLDAHHLKAAQTNLRELGPFELKKWDARKLPIGDASVDRVVTNPPFGKQLGTPEEMLPLYHKSIGEMHRVLKPGGIAILLVSDVAAMKDAVRMVPWNQLHFVPIRILGLPAVILGYQKSR
jgi:tRNA (guanine6-N2)-methyltransferase